MGIENIITLQDIDKLKIVLFDNDQRKIFEQLPKPGITKKRLNKDSEFTIESIVKPKPDPKQNSFDSIRKLKFSTENDPLNSLNKRLFEMVESRKSLRKTTQKGFFFSNLLFFFLIFLNKDISSLPPIGSSIHLVDSLQKDKKIENAPNFLKGLFSFRKKK